MPDRTPDKMRFRLKLSRLCSCRRADSSCVGCRALHGRIKTSMERVDMQLNRGFEPCLALQGAARQRQELAGTLEQASSRRNVGLQQLPQSPLPLSGGPELQPVAQSSSSLSGRSELQQPRTSSPLPLSAMRAISPTAPIQHTQYPPQRDFGEAFSSEVFSKTAGSLDSWATLDSASAEKRLRLQILILGIYMPQPCSKLAKEPQLVLERRQSAAEVVARPARAAAAQAPLPACAGLLCQG